MFIVQFNINGETVYLGKGGLYAKDKGNAQPMPRSKAREVAQVFRGKVSPA